MAGGDLRIREKALIRESGIYISEVPNLYLLQRVAESFRCEVFTGSV